MPKDKNIDGGNFFDWGRTSSDYAKYRDIYPELFYRKILDSGLCVKGQRVLDIGTGTGVLPRNLYPYGARFVGTDISENQIEQARRLSAESGMDIEYRCVPSEEIDFPAHSFDVVTACQCFFYFDHKALAPKLKRILKPGGKLAVLYMAWLPFEDRIAGASEKLVLKYNPSWSGCNETRHDIFIPEAYGPYFEKIHSEIYDLEVPFTRESWNGRMKACRGIGASLTAEETGRFEEEHLRLLSSIAPESFTVLHYAAITILKAKA